MSTCEASGASSCAVCAMPGCADPDAPAVVWGRAIASSNPLLRACAEICADVLATLERKNADYAGGDPWRNFESAELAGVDPARAILVRDLDKIARAGNLLGSGAPPAVAGEALADTARDHVGYALLFAAYLETHGIR